MSPLGEEERVVFRTRGDLARDRLPGLVLATLVVIVQLAWGAVLVYLGFHFLYRLPESRRAPQELLETG